MAVENENTLIFKCNKREFVYDGDTKKLTEISTGKSAQLKRKIFKMAALDETVYFIDRESDCFMVDDEMNLSFVFGILTLPDDFKIENDLFYVRSDKFNRIWHYTVNGKIKQISQIN